MHIMHTSYELVVLFILILELVAEDLKNSRSGLDELLGKKFSDSLLGDIFSSFCIGK